MFSLPDGFCYLDSLLARRMPVMMALGAFPRLEKIKAMRIALKKVCIDDLHIAHTVMRGSLGPVIKFKGENLYPRCLHLSRNRYSYGEQDFEQMFSPEEMGIFSESPIEEETIDEQIDALLQEQNSGLYHEYYFVGSDIVKKLDSERDIMSSGFTAIEEASIISNFKRRIDLGIPVDEALKSSRGLDVWTIRRQGMSGVKRFIESRICDIARSYGKKPRRKLNVAQMELLKRADDCVLEELFHDKEIKTPDLKNSISRASLASVDKDSLDAIVPNMKVVKNKRSLDAESFCNVSDLGSLIKEIGNKVGKDLDKIEQFNKMDSRIDDMLLKAEKVQGIYEDLLSKGQEKKDPHLFKRSIESIHTLYENLVKEEIESLERYGEATKELVEEYNKNLMFDEVPDRLKNKNILKNINQIIEESDQESLKTKRVEEVGSEPLQENDDLYEMPEMVKSKPVELKIESDDTDYSSGDRTGFLFQRSEEEKINELKIVGEVERVMSRRYNQRAVKKDDSLTKNECLSELYKEFGIGNYESHSELNRTKKEVFLFIYRRVMYLYGFDVNLKYPEDPKKSDSYFKTFLRFYNKYMDNKTLLQTKNIDIINFWKNLFSGGTNKDRYKVPEAPTQRIFIEDQKLSNELFDKRVETYNSGLEQKKTDMKEYAEIEEEISKKRQKMEKAEKADIPKGFKIQAKNKLTSQIEELKQNQRRLKMKVYPSKPIFRTEYSEITNPAWEEHMRILTRGTRREMIKRGWLDPGVSLDPSSICDLIINFLEKGTSTEEKYRMRIALDHKNMFHQTNSNDFWKKINIKMVGSLQMDSEDFLSKTVDMFYDMVDKEMSNKTAKLIRFLCAEQETRILCSIISYYSYGYISKKFLPIRKKYRRDICNSLDGLIK
jgi:hypothetical protein